MKLLASLVIIFLNIQLLHSQAKNDYIWFFGDTFIDDYTVTLGSIVNFNKNGNIDTISIGDVIAGNNAIICDSTGKLLFYHGGCSVVDSTHHIMDNGDSINFGESWERFCLNGRRYPGWRNSIILPDPGNYQNKKGYYLIHKRVEKQDPFIQTYSPELYYSYIDLNGNNGKGTVREKNKRIFRTTNIVNGYLSACKHANGRDWWMIQMRRDTNIYFKILLTKDTIMAVDSQSIGNNFTIYTNVGQSVFSPDGTKWIMYGDMNGKKKGCGGALVYDFDMETGHLSNMQFIETQDSGSWVGVAISPNSRYAYLSAVYDMYQIDLQADDIQGSLTNIAHWDGFHVNGSGVAFSFAQLAPDCKIYVAAATFVNYMSVINKPDEKGLNCDFRQHAIMLPYDNYPASIPNFPHFRMDEAEICDPTITSMFGEAVWIRRDLEVWPNPSSGIFSIRLPDVGSGTLVVMNMDGQIVYQKEMSNIIPDVQINISNYPDGGYFIEFYPDVSKERVYWGSKIMKVKGN